jgi:hypothetical protein
VLCHSSYNNNIIINNKLVVIYIKMQSNHKQKMLTGPGPGAPVVASHVEPTLPIIVHPVIHCPTPTTSASAELAGGLPRFNMVNRSEIVAHPAKGINNPQSINHNQASTQIPPQYLCNQEEIKNKSITCSDFSTDNVPIDEFWERTKEEYDDEVATEIDEAMEVIMRAFNLPNGVLNVRRSKKFKEALIALHYGTGEIINIIEQPVTLNVPSVPSVPSVPNLSSIVPSMTLSPGESEMRMPLSAQLTIHIEQPCDFCDQFGRMQKLGKFCSQCAKNKDLDYCIKTCWHCEKNRRAYSNADSRVTTSQYVQVIKQERVDQMLSKLPLPVINNPHIGVQASAGIFNRIGNFVDKFLAVTYTLDVADMTRDILPYLVRQLEDNFFKLTQIKDMPCKGYLYVIEYTNTFVPHLHGLVRMSSENVGSIAASNLRFIGKNKIITRRPGDNGFREEKLKMLLKPINVEGWIAYMIKMYVITGTQQFKGYLDRIIDGWDYREAPPMCPF